MTVIENDNFIQALVHYVDFSLENVKFNLKNRGYVNKPEKALWTSTWKDDVSQIGWIKWARMERFDIKDSLYKVTPKRIVILYEIDLNEDYASDQLPKTKENFIDYQKLASKGYDGLHLTEHGAWIGHDFRKENEHFGTTILLNSFDCESTVWFNTDWIGSIEKMNVDF